MIRAALTLGAVLRLALRRTEGLIRSILKLLGLDLVEPDHPALSRCAEKLEVTRPCLSSRISGIHPAQCRDDPVLRSRAASPMDVPGLLLPSEQCREQATLLIGRLWLNIEQSFLSRCLYFRYLFDLGS